MYELESSDKAAMHQLIDTIAQRMNESFNADKMNIATLGNIVPQLHIHIIARFKTDAFWPAPIWGQGSSEPYSTHHLKQRVTQFEQILQGLVQRTLGSPNNL